MSAKPTTISIDRALAPELEKLGAPFVLRYDLARIAWTLYKARTYAGHPLSIKSTELDSRAFVRLEKKLQDNGVLKPIPGISERTAYGLIGSYLVDRNAIICSIDVFCYLSHLSAMEFHGLTNRLPEQIYVSSPQGKEWTAFAQNRMGKDLGADYEKFKAHNLPLLRRTAIAKIGQRPVHRYSTQHQGAFRTIKGSPIRVATIGRTFLDMLREPNLCGGLFHTFSVFKEHAAIHLRLILDELDQHGLPIDKIRAGFILEDICRIRDPRINAWAQYASRGGSRKLDPSADYAPHFSERWMLSINTSTPDDTDD